MLPVSEAVYDFRTDLREDEFNVTTEDVTSANVTLGKPLYEDDTGTIDIISDESTDNATFGSYTTGTRVLNITALSANVTRILTVSYDIDALEGSDALNTFVGYIPWIWMLIIIVFPIAGLAAIFTGRAD